MVATAAQRSAAKIWSPSLDDESEHSVFTAEMAPYLDDPFRGAIERRVLAPGETALSLELPAARAALTAAKLDASDLDLILASAFLPDQPGIGNAAPVARELGVRCPAWNLESACSGALVALEQAVAFVKSGAYRKILIVISCSYSRLTEVTDSLSWTVGDGAAAFVVTELPAGTGMLGVKTINTADSHGVMYFSLEVDEQRPHIWMRASATAGASLRAMADHAIFECSHGAAAAAGVSLADIDFFVFPTPVAWFRSFYAKRLGIPLHKTLSTHALYANTGPVLMPTNLYYAARLGKLRPGSLVMLNTLGLAANVSTAVVRWSDVALGRA
ncbi:MAG TPA: 3-oxoacyl-[acyl-carrier-protein] synthase III C-terminal domain-containing protein, partial [Enhygromyxa sp.]|nr:3-oxoacyl-[acyl-carrier-protein] synthase III C-terminal domain-containing protein [Enhygromyxa sp.]